MVEASSKAGLLDRPLVRYGVAAAAVGCGTLLRWVLSLWVGPGLPMYITFYPAVMLAAVLCGLRAGLAATVLTAVAVDYWFLPPEGWSFWKLGLTDTVGVVLFLAMGTFMSLVADLYRRNRQKAAAYEKEVALREGEALRAAEREREQEKLRESEERFRLLFQQAAVGIKRLDRQGRILEVNDKQCDILGYSREELLRMSLADITHAEDLPIEQAELSRLWSGAIPSYHIEKRSLRKDGTLIWVRVTSSLPSGGGTPAEWWVSVVEDITPRKRVEENLRRTAEELARSNRDLEQFAYVSSHDLQEPLRMVTGFMQLFEQKYAGKIDAAADRYIHYAVDGAKRMRRLIEDLLAYSRVGAKAKDLAPVDSGEVLRGVLAGLGPSIEESRAEVTAGELPTVQADATQLSQVFQNLIGNAIKFRGDQPPKIRVEARREAANWVFSVADNGIGFDPEFREKVFVIFQRLHTKDKYPGTGIGLAICKRIVERHGGRIWAESKASQGSTFCFTLPARE